MKKRILFLFVAMLLAVPSMSFARGFGGGHSFSSHTSISHTTTSHSSYTSRPTVNLSKSTTTRTTTHSTGYRSPSYSASSTRHVTYHAGSTYTSRSTRVYVNHHYVNVNHYYHAGYSPSGWFGYYHGFTHAMILSSLWHPWGGTYYVGHSYVNYGPSPVAWGADILGGVIIIAAIVTLCIIF